MKRPPPSTTLSAKLFPYPTLCRSRGHKYAPVLVSHGEVDQRREEHRDGQRDQQQPADVQDRSELDHAVARPPGRSTADGQASRAPRARSHGGVQPPLVPGTVGDPFGTALLSLAPASREGDRKSTRLNSSH